MNLLLRWWIFFRAWTFNVIFGNESFSGSLVLYFNNIVMILFNWLWLKQVFFLNIFVRGGWVLWFCFLESSFKEIWLAIFLFSLIWNWTLFELVVYWTFHLMVLHRFNFLNTFLFPLIQGIPIFDISSQKLLVKAKLILILSVFIASIKNFFDFFIFFLFRSLSSFLFSCFVLRYCPLCLLR